MTTTREAIAEAINEHLGQQTPIRVSPDGALIDRLLSITSWSGEVSDEEIEKEAKRRTQAWQDFARNNNLEPLGIVQQLSNEKRFCDGARWLRSKSANTHTAQDGGEVNE